MISVAFLSNLRKIEVLGPADSSSLRYVKIDGIQTVLRDAGALYVLRAKPERIYQLYHKQNASPEPKRHAKPLSVNDSTSLQLVEV